MKCFEQSRDMIFEVAGLLSDNEGFDFYQTWVVDMLKYFSTWNCIYKFDIMFIAILISY